MGMDYLGLLCFIPLVLMHFLAVPAQQQIFLTQFCISGRGNYTTNSTYEANLDSLVSSFSNTTVDGGFYNSSAGEVKAVALCKGDLTPEECRTCIDYSSHDLKRFCPNYKEAIIYYDTCSFRYSDRSIFGFSEIAPHLLCVNSKKFSDVNQINAVWPKLFSGLRDEAAASGPLRKYAVGETVLDDSSDTIYALVQCTPDLQDTQCAQCLDNLNATTTSKIPNLTEAKGANILGPSCNFRYETYLFYELPSDAPSPAPSPSLSPATDFPSPSSTATSGKGMLLKPPYMLQLLQDRLFFLTSINFVY